MKIIEKIDYDWDEEGSHLLEQVVNKINELVEEANRIRRLSYPIIDLEETESKK